ncbi:NAD(+) kinase [Deferribacter desulfuricans SSM1]|uniref:NAD kinase n=1 Tax=Deferribacter desulfuricans (strain DSM 14783 / JCM 11476 / NBRC 101012 / SSM1) TaxID=639282 RepID=D3PCU1_DEFDS|nr:NAD(+)/NADH kinase [Deferribacter desulfuricans]BAI80414.1 NAD(+) kinase [Deferribacter desulfuricans SSM1]
MNNITLIVKPHSEAAKPLAEQIYTLLKEKGKNILLEKRAAGVLNLPENSAKEIKEKSELIIVLGGDGTLISAIRLVEDKDIPILGINLGRLGFLTETKVEEAIQVIENIIEDNFRCEQRMKLNGKIVNGEAEFSMDVLNDIVIHKGALARIIEMDVFIDNMFVNTYRADGLIIATPTGSTAYSLAAGGPIVIPTMNSILITPICPHSLTHRPVVVPDNSEIKIIIKSEDEKIFITFDGQIGKKLEKNDEIIIKKSKNYARLIIPKNRNYYSLLREKLHWGDK